MGSIFTHVEVVKHRKCFIHDILIMFRCSLCQSTSDIVIVWNMDGNIIALSIGCAQSIGISVPRQLSLDELYVNV